MFSARALHYDIKRAELHISSIQLVLKTMYKPLIAILMVLGAGGVALGQAEAQEVREEQSGISRDVFVHPFILAMQKCWSAYHSAERCGGVEANEVRAIVGHSKLTMDLQWLIIVANASLPLPLCTPCSSLLHSHSRHFRFLYRVVYS